MKRGFVFLAAPFFVLMLAALLLPKSGAGQEINDYSSEFSIETIPGEPRPGERVSAKIVSYQFDPNRSDITWTLDGKIIARGPGVKAAEFILPALGKESVLKVDIVANNGAKTSKTRKFSGSDIDFLWEALTTVPAGYKGKALPAYKSIIKITALPHLFANGSRVSSSGLVYEWSVNYKKKPDISGAGKNNIRLQLSDFGEYAVGLTVSTADKRLSFQKYFHISAEGTKPKVVLYGDSQMEGPLYHRVFGPKVELGSKEVTLRAEPYYFTSEKGEDISFKWFMNDNALKSKRYPNIVSLVKEKETGMADIGVEINNERPKTAQSAREYVKISF